METEFWSFGFYFSFSQKKINDFINISVKCWLLVQ